MIENADEAQLDSFQNRAAEHGLAKSLLESFAYVRPFGGMFGKIVPFYAESYWYAMGGLTFLMFIFLTGSGILLALLGPYWWLGNPIGLFLKSFHYWSAQGFFFFALLHLFRVWATGSYRGRAILNWWIGLMLFMLAIGENLFGLLARGDWESQFVGSLGIAVIGSTYSGSSSKQAISFQIQENALEQMLHIEQTIATPLENLEFVVQTFNKATGVSVDKVVHDLMPPPLQRVQERIETTQAAMPHPLLPGADLVLGLERIRRLFKDGGQLFPQEMCRFQFGRIAEETRQAIGVRRASSPRRFCGTPTGCL